jgi:hypothetical protein
MTVRAGLAICTGKYSTRVLAVYAHVLVRILEYCMRLRLLEYYRVPRQVLSTKVLFPLYRIESNQGWFLRKTLQNSFFNLIHRYCTRKQLISAECLVNHVACLCKGLKRVSARTNPYFFLRRLKYHKYYVDRAKWRFSSCWDSTNRVGHVLKIGTDFMLICSSQI